MLRETVLSAVVAGLIAALALTAMQAVWITPLILKAEAFESGEAPGVQRGVGPAQAGAHAHKHATAGDDSADAHEHVAAANYPVDAHDHTAGAAAEHHHDSGEWRPR